MRNVGGIAQTEAQKSSDLFMKLRKPRLGSVIRTLWGKLQSRDRFAKRGSPTVKMLQPIPYKGVVLQVPLHGIHLDHRVTDGRPRCENYATVARDFVQIATLHKQIA